VTSSASWATEPEPITPAERAAVELVASYLHRGIEGWWPALAAESPFRALGRDRAERELAVRLGPRERVSWSLRRGGPRLAESSAVFVVEFPSGMEDTVVLGMLEEDGAWSVRHVRTLVDPVEGRNAGYELLDAIADAGGGAKRAGRAGLFGWLACLLLGLGAGSRAARPAVGAGVLVLSSVLLLASCDRGSESAAPEPVTTSEVLPLAELDALRTALALGSDAAQIEALGEAVSADGPTGEVAAIWLAEHALRGYRLNEVEEALASRPEPSSYPLVELVRARLEALRGDGEEALQHYEHVRESGLDHDGIRLEAAEVLALFGDDDSSDVAYFRAAGLGSRDADAYYALAQTAYVEDRDDEAERLFRVGWRLRPLDRETLFSDALLASLATRESLFPLFGFASFEEPSSGRVPWEREPADLPAGARAEVLGELLLVGFGETELRVPGGAVLAAPDSPVIPASELGHREEERSLARLEELREQAGSPGVLTRPALLRQIERAGFALLRDRRYAELLELTAALSERQEHVPPMLAQLRSRALMKLDRSEEAVDLLVPSAPTPRRRSGSTRG
jgi:hypothetical protein